MATVRIPDSHFTKSVRLEYQNPELALVREMLQNSTDAGATQVDFTVDDEGVLTCSDNGSGMTEEILVNALLTMSGSHKGVNAVGGFGAAKSLILFQHDWYKIHTNDIHVSGKVLEYDLTHDEGDVRKGTSITIKLAAEHFNKWSFCYTAREFLASCELEAKITFNGDQITCAMPQGREVRDLGWSKVYAKKLKQMTNYCHVRIRGITMFSPYIGEIDQHIVIDVTKPSTEILTVNRDGFTSKYSGDLQTLTQEIIIEKASFGRAYNQHVIYRGENRSFSVEDLASKAGAAISDALHQIRTGLRQQITGTHKDLAISVEDINTMVAAKANALANEAAVSLNNTTAENANRIFSAAARHVSGDLGLGTENQNKVLRTVYDRVSDLSADFTVYVKGRGFNKIPNHLNPNTMGKRYRTLAKMWKHCIKLALKANDLQTPYSIGWVLDHEIRTEALINDNKGVQTFLINPCLDWIKDSTPKEAFFKMLMIASHEITHLNRKWHDEIFTANYDAILHKTLMSVDSWWNEYLAIKEEVI